MQLLVPSGQFTALPVLFSHPRDDYHSGELDWGCRISIWMRCTPTNAALANSGGIKVKVERLASNGGTNYQSQVALWDLLFVRCVARTAIRSK